MLAARGNAIVITNFCHLAAKFIYLRFDQDHTKSQTALTSRNNKSALVLALPNGCLLRLPCPAPANEGGPGIQTGKLADPNIWTPPRLRP